MTVLHNEFSKLTKVVLRTPQDAFKSEQKISEEWHKLGYTSAPNFLQACKEYENFLKILDDHQIEQEFLPSSNSLTIDSIYVRDASIITPKGHIICHTGKAERRVEGQKVKEYFKSRRYPILGEITSEGMIEGGDIIWFNSNLVAIAHSYRTNHEGIRQFKNLLGDDIKVLVVPLPHYNGPRDVFHLMSIISPLDQDLALVYSPLMPIVFREWLLRQGIDLIEVPESEFLSMGPNVLAIAPRVAVALDGNPETRKNMERAGVHVIPFKGNEISLKGQGGPTCLTRPIVRYQN